ncbi:MAG: hypothetical protein ABI967_06490 [bacterium]
MLIDDTLPTYDVREQHEIRVRAPREKVYAEIRKLDLRGARLTMCLMRLRGMPVQGNFTLDDFLKMRFILLGETPNEELLLGLVGRFWTVAGGLCRLTAEEYRNFHEPGFAKAAWNFSVSDLPDHSTLLATETRVLCLDEVSRKRFKLYWLFVGSFSGLLRRDILKTIKRNAER